MTHNPHNPHKGPAAPAAGPFPLQLRARRGAARTVGGMNDHQLPKGQRFTLAVGAISVLHAIGLDPATDLGAAAASRIVGRLDLTVEELDEMLDWAERVTLHRTVALEPDELDEEGWMRLPLDDPTTTTR